MDLQAHSFQLHQYKSCVRILNIEKQSELIIQLERKLEEQHSVELLTLAIEQLFEIGQIVSKKIDNKIGTLKL